MIEKLKFILNKCHERNISSIMLLFLYDKYVPKINGSQMLKYFFLQIWAYQTTGGTITFKLWILKKVGNVLIEKKWFKIMTKAQFDTSKNHP